MALELKDLANIVSATIRQLANSRGDLLTRDQISISIDEVQFQVQLIAPNGVGAIELAQITATPTRISTTETPETVEVSTQQVGAQVNRVVDQATKQASSTQQSDQDTTQQYGRQTLSETRHKD
jgi:hypothetical protein